MPGTTATCLIGLDCEAAERPARRSEEWQNRAWADAVSTGALTERKFAAKQEGIYLRSQDLLIDSYSQDVDPPRLHADGDDDDAEARDAWDQTAP
eukprot:3324207-Pyramimonas_sp.AAC.1